MPDFSEFLSEDETRGMMFVGDKTNGHISTDNDGDYLILYIPSDIALEYGDGNSPGYRIPIGDVHRIAALAQELDARYKTLMDDIIARGIQDVRYPADLSSEETTDQT